MTELRAFHGDPAVKQKYVDRLRAHHAADDLIQGHYWQEGKGCAVGCTIHGDEHDRYETELGLPEWLARLEDRIFEGLPNAAAKDFARDFLEAIPVGADVSRVQFQFLAFLMEENLKRVSELAIADDLKSQVSEAIRGVLALHQRAATAEPWDESEWSAAESAAWSAARSAWSAWSAAWSGARSAESAESAARSAESAAWSAWSAESAAWSAWSAAWSGARSAESAESAARSAARSAELAESAELATYELYAAKLLDFLRAS